jgi:5-methyltetrahydrofolate--homocysteine methyltransferase
MVPTAKIVSTAREMKVDIVGLSGLITPSLEEMCNVASEFERGGFDLPLLIGGATTSLIHTAVKIAPSYGGPTVYVPDASKSVGVVTKLLSKDLKDGYLGKLSSDYSELRIKHERRTRSTDFLPLAEARKNRLNLDWKSYLPEAPNLLGTEVFSNYDLKELVSYIDWTPFLQSWELKGRYPEILDDPLVGEEAGKLVSDARELLEDILEGHSLRANGMVGIFPANSVGDDIEIYSDNNREKVVWRFHHLRQQTRKASGRPNRCLSDFVAPRDSHIEDYIGCFAVSSGFGTVELVRKFEARNDDYQSILVKAVADRLAEAFAERLHERVRKELWGYAADEHLDSRSLIREQYRGIRPAPGYPACPDHSEKLLLFEFLSVKDSVSIDLTENFAMIPAASVCGFYFSHPDAHYFGVGKIDRDQVEDYSRRKGVDLRQLETWLAPILGY